MSRIETISTGKINYSKVGYCSDIDKIARYKMQYGDILFSHINSIKHIAKTAYYIAEKPLYHGMNLLLLRCNNNVDSKFFFYLINNIRFIRRCQVLAKQAVNQASISTSDLKRLMVFIPCQKEQIRIQQLLSLIDDRIATQRKIIEKLESLMRGIAVSFTAQKPNTKISDCLICHSSTLQENQVTSSGEYQVYGANGVCGFTDQPEVKTDSILIVKDGSGVGTVHYAEGAYSVIGTSNYLTAKDGYLLKYLYYCLMCFNFTPYKTGMAIPHIYFKDYGKAKIYCPSIDEQIQIATILSKLDDKIENEKTILQQYTIQKQYLLQQMFI